jgi:HTH-type transcriptional regulator/antitoxin MqsA
MNMTRKNEVFTCEVCGRESAYLVTRSFDAIYNQMPIHLEAVEMYECDRCGESTLTPEQDKNLCDRVKAAARERLELLPPEAVLAIRKRHGLTQEELERLLGVGKKVVIRWEKGRVLQSSTADVLLRLIDRNPDIINQLREIRSPKP